MNIDRKKSILLKIKLKGFCISHQLEDNYIESFEHFYDKRIAEKEEIIDALREIEKKLAEKKMLNNNESILIELLGFKV